MSDKHIDYDYYNTLTIKASPAKFEFHGKPNTPNLLFHDGSQTKKYVTTAIYLIKPSNPMFDGELVIEHKLITNYGERMFTHFPLKTDASISENEIDRLLSIDPGDSLEVNLNKVIVEQSECIYKDTNVAMFTEPILIKTQIIEHKLDNVKIIEGACSASDKQSKTDNKITLLENNMKEVLKHIKNENKHSSGAGAGTSGVGDGSKISQSTLDALLASKTLQCDAIQDKSKDDYIAKLLNVPTSNDTKQLNTANSLATILMVMIVSILSFFIITTAYKDIFVRLYSRLQHNIEKSVTIMGIIEGFLPFVFFITFLISGRTNRKSNVAASAAMLWLFYSIVIGLTKKKIVDEITDPSKGSQYIQRPLWKNVLFFYPLWPLVAIYDIWKMQKSSVVNEE